MSKLPTLAPPTPSVAQMKRGPPVPKSTEAVECCAKDQNQTQLHLNSTMSIMRRHPSTTWSSITNMPKDIAAFAIDKPVRADIKARDMQMHHEAEQMDQFQRAAVFLKSDQLSEKIFVANKTVEYVESNMARYFKEIFPAMERELKQESEELHAAAADAFTAAYTLLMKTPSNASNANLFVQVMFKMLDSKNANICQMWSTAVLDLVNTVVGPTEIERDFLPLLVASAKSVHPNVRKFVAIMIKFFILRSPPLGKALSPSIAMLLEDAAPIVRGTMCQQLGPIYHNMPSKDGLTTHINRICKDNDPFVKKSLVITIGGIFKYPDMKQMHDLILQLLKRTIKEAFVQGNVETLVEFTTYLGEMAKVLADAGSLNGDSKLWFLDAFIQLSRMGISSSPAADENVESLVSSGAQLTGTNAARKKAVNADGWRVRASAAKDFINFFKFAKPLVDFRIGIQPLMGDLIHDPNENVRAGMSNCFWPVMEALGNNGHILHGEFVYILSDDSLEVVEGIAPHISKILKVLVNGKIISPELPTQGLVEIGGALIFCEERLSQSNSWRIHTQFLGQFVVLPFCFPGDYIYNNFVPNLFHRLIHLNQLPARMGVADALVVFLRNCRRAVQREEIRRRIRESFAKGKSVQDRMLYLYMARKIIDAFSRKYFREHFFDQTLKMTDDAIANVRMKAVNMMPDMKNTLQRSEDDKLLQKLDDAAMRLRANETDGDVLNAIDEAIRGMQKIALRFAGDKAPKTKADAEDEAKEKEEAYIEGLEFSLKPGKETASAYYKSPAGAAEQGVRRKSTPGEPDSRQEKVQKEQQGEVKPGQPAPRATRAVEAISAEHRFRRRTYNTGEIVPLSNTGVVPPTTIPPAPKK